MGEEELQAAILRASRAFLRDPSEAALEAILSRYSLYWVAVHGSESGLEAELAKIEWQARNIMTGRP